MTNVAETFFNSLSLRAPAAMPGPMTGTLRVDLTDDGISEHWLVTFSGRLVKAAREMVDADAVWQLPREVFEQLASGRSNPIATVLRNETTFGGDVALFLAFRRFFPDMPGSHDPRLLAMRHGDRK
ncbi:SCP2 sterol-binding domain-containing protein [Micromonospora sp. NBS 11-29]|uniref:SCP2 sterol-binding domain-containing protein n=1 Tax=Micromonospora sp. NBS 11-29 TaxID=1960879 RepID=UPI000B77D941|nr:SCP2 sterol-binding domain-containing protein [Micromonospora sp. NBS 11-29]